MIISQLDFYKANFISQTNESASQDRRLIPNAVNISKVLPPTGVDLAPGAIQLAICLGFLVEVVDIGTLVNYYLTRFLEFLRYFTVSTTRYIAGFLRS